jgi:hypothetical protein
MIIKLFLIGLAAMAVTGCSTPADRTICKFDGDVFLPQYQWSYHASNADGKEVYIPFEGFYPDKGGKLRSPVFELPDDNGKNQYCRLKFKAWAAESTYWWLEYLDKDGKWLPDCNSAVYPGGDMRQYDEMAILPVGTKKVQVVFVSKGKVKVKDLELSISNAAAAAEWCDQLYATIPPITAKVTPAVTLNLSKTTAALQDGRAFKVLMLGDSIVNDSYNSVFPSLVKRQYPNSNFTFIISVSGSTGCLTYAQNDKFKQYIAAYQPDLLLISGVSNFVKNTPEEITALKTVVSRAKKELGCEVVIATPPLSVNPQEYANSTEPWRKLIQMEKMYRFLGYEQHVKVAAEEQVALWDLTEVVQDYKVANPQVKHSRDPVHNDDIGKQLIGRLLAQYFAQLAPANIEGIK